MNNIKTIIYTAGVIVNNNNLIKDIPPYYSTVYAHHMTIQYGFDTTELPDYIGKEFTFVADKKYSDENAIALTGSINEAEIKNIMNMNNQHAHITIATANGTKPVYSNELIKSESFVNINKINIKMKAGAYVIFDDGKKDWVFEK